MDDYPFDDFWSIYPRKVARAYAERCWTKLSPAYRQLALGAISTHVEHWKARKLDWDKLPHCSTWLNQQRWNDELPKINGRSSVSDGMQHSQPISKPSGLGFDGEPPAPTPFRSLYVTREDKPMAEIEELAAAVKWAAVRAEDGSPARLVLDRLAKGLKEAKFEFYMSRRDRVLVIPWPEGSDK